MSIEQCESDSAQRKIGENRQNIEKSYFCQFVSNFYVAFVLLEAPKTAENSSRSKVGPEVGLGGLPESRSKSYTFDLLLTYFQGPPRNLLLDLLLTCLNFLGFPGPLGGQRQDNPIFGISVVF